MIYHATVHGTQSVKPPFAEENGDHVYLRMNIERVTVKGDREGEEDRQEWRYNETVLTRLEYQNILQGRLMSGEWTDALRTAERSQRYREADDMIAKYSTDATDAAMKKKWIEYKAAVRATQDAAGYPTQVTYPDLPE